MHLPTLATLLTTTLTLVSATKTLNKRCSPRYDPDLALGYYPPAPCWQTFDPACQPHLAQGTEMTVDGAHGLAVVYGVSESCAGEIAEELRREAAGTKNYGWVREHGWLSVIEPEHTRGGERVLVISGMSEEAVAKYEGLGYMK